MTKNRLKWDSNRLLSLTAMLISLFTLIIFVYQTNLLRRQNFISIRPYLSVETSDDAGNNQYRIDLTNNGVGPAVLERVRFRYNDTWYDLVDFDHSLYSFLVARAPALDTLRSISFSLVEPGRAIPANTTYNLFTVNDSGTGRELVARTLERLLDEGTEYEIVYRSIQDERWKITTADFSPLRLD